MRYIQKLDKFREIEIKTNGTELRLILIDNRFDEIVRKKVNLIKREELTKKKKKKSKKPSKLLAMIERLSEDFKEVKKVFDEIKQVALKKE